MQVEAALIVSPYVDNIMMHADPFHSYCVALVVASQSAVEEWAAKQGIVYNDFAELCEKEETLKEVYASILKVCLADQIIRNLEFNIFIKNNTEVIFTLCYCDSFLTHRRARTLGWISLRSLQRSNCCLTCGVLKPVWLLQLSR